MLTISQRRFYLVSISRHESLHEANRDALSIRNMGGAGFVLHGNDAFYVIVAVYRSRREANGVKERLVLEEGFLATVFVRIVPRIRISVGDSGKANTILQLITHPISLIDSLTTLSFDLSARRITEMHALFLLNSKRNNLLILSGRINELSLEFPNLTAPLQEFYSTMLSAFSSAGNLSFAPTLSVNILHLVPLIIESYNQTILTLRLVA